MRILKHLHKQSKFLLSFKMIFIFCLLVILFFSKNNVHSGVSYRFINLEETQTRLNKIDNKEYQKPKTNRTPDSLIDQNLVNEMKKNPEDTKKHFLSAGIGTTLLQYSQTNKPDFSSIMLTIYLNYQFRLSKSWDLNVNAFFNSLKLSSNISGVTMRVFGANVRIGYDLIQSGSWNLMLYGGVYYNTSFVTGANFGVGNIYGPQLYPMLRKKLNSKNSVFTYFKYSPITSDFTFRDMSNNRELAFGLGWVTINDSGHPIIYSLNISDLDVLIQGRSSSTQSYSIGVTYGF